MEIRQPDIIINRGDDTLLLWLNSLDRQVEGEYRYTNSRWLNKENSLFRIKDNSLEFNHPWLGNTWCIWDSTHSLSSQENVKNSVKEFIASLDSILLGTPE